MKMKRIVLLLATIILLFASGEAQKPIPKGASKFFNELGGLRFTRGNSDILQQIAGNKIDKVEGGGGTIDWTKVDGRIFARAAWMVEIGGMVSDYGAFELERSLAIEMQKTLTSEGFRMIPANFDLHYIRYQKGSTIGTVEVRSFFLNNGKLPLRYEFIFNESYRPVKGSR